MTMNTGWRSQCFLSDSCTKDAITVEVSGWTSYFKEPVSTPSPALSNEAEPTAARKNLLQPPVPPVPTPQEPESSRDPPALESPVEVTISRPQQNVESLAWIQWQAAQHQCSTRFRECHQH